MKEVPLRNHQYDYEWRERTRELRYKLGQMGLDDFLLANNEFGLGHKQMYFDFTRYTKSMINIEMAMEMYKSGLDMMALWDNTDSGHSRSSHPGDAMLMDSQNSYRMNPVHFGLEMLFRAGDMKMIDMTTTAYRLHGFCAADGGVRLLCYMMNKYLTEQTIKFSEPFGEEASVAVETLVDTEDHWGEVNSVSYLLPVGDVWEHTVPPLSFVTFTFNWQ